MNLWFCWNLTFIFSYYKNKLIWSGNISSVLTQNKALLLYYYKALIYWMGSMFWIPWGKSYSLIKSIIANEFQCVIKWAQILNIWWSTLYFVSQDLIHAYQFFFKFNFLPGQHFQWTCLIFQNTIMSKTKCSVLKIVTFF